MNRVVKTIYLTIIALLIVSLVTLNLNYYKADALIDEEVSQRIQMASDLVNSEIDHWADLHRTVLYGLRDVIQIAGTSRAEQIITLLRDTVEANPTFTSIYFGMPDKTLWFSHDWTPTPGFDLTVRPWYVEAVQAGHSILTEPFEDAYTGEQVVCIAMPIYEANGALMGVLSGDILIGTIASSLEAFTAKIGGISYLVDSGDNIIVQFGDVSDAIGIAQLTQYEAQLSETERQSTSLDAVISGVEGFFQHYEIIGTDWRLLSFSTMSAHNTHARDLRVVMNVLIGLLIGIFLVFLGLQRKYVVHPLVHLENQIAAIDVENTTDVYQIELGNNGIFDRVQSRINALLLKLYTHLREINADKEELHALNEELEASFSQMVAVEQEVSMQKLNFEALFRNSPTAIAMFDQNHRIMDINNSFETLFGYTLNEIYGKNLDEVVAQSKDPEAASKTDAVFRGDLVDFEAIRFNRYSEPINVRITGVSIQFEGRVIGGYGIYTDISASVDREKHLNFVSEHDYLTDVFNRRHFERAIASSDQESALPLSLVMVDVNGLKLINDAFGNEMGDRMLKMTADLLKTQAAAVEAPVFRIGGDEFAIILEHTESHLTERFAKNIRKLCRTQKLGELQLSLAIGWAERLTLETPIQQVMKEAEDFMFKHKLNENPSIRGKTINTIMNTLHEKSKREEQHSKRVSDISYTLGKALGLKQRDLDALRMMGLLHDVGKIAIDDKILNKAGKLTPEEYETMKRHPEIGYRILSSVNELSEIASHVLAHHERWDGKGYPKGIKGDAIPYLARVISVADAYDAMTSNRSYRQGLSTAEAIDELKRFSGIQFDPEIVTVFIRLIEAWEET
jgi:diguanylate cyclase (GGDEF)-like protein/PAS domain S-box-containing protein/putative nucleotidyltransferase with HDIG domain